MPNGLAIHIGVNRVDPACYGGSWSGDLDACENDARDICTIATSQGFEANTLLTTRATRDAVLGAVHDAAERLESGDLLLISYSGHGGQIADIDGDEDDLKDETWCLYDGQLLDDELYVAWSQFAPGVRIWVLSDSCHSGSVIKEVTEFAGGIDTNAGPATEDNCLAGHRYRFLPRRTAVATWRKNRSFYTAIQTQLPKPRPPIRATVRLMSGCHDNQLSFETKANGRFTAALRDAWADGAFSGNYAKFHQAIRHGMPAKQQSNHLVIGAANNAFDNQRPFEI